MFMGKTLYSHSLCSLALSNDPVLVICDRTRLLKVFFHFWLSFCFHSQEQTSHSTPSLFEETNNTPNYLYKRQLGNKKMCLICDCKGNLSLSTKPNNDRHCFFTKLCTNRKSRRC